MDIHINNEQFITYLRSALHYLYDPDQLRRSPLTTLFGIAERVDAASALQEILLGAVEELKPGDNESPQSRGWMVYDVLFFRYVRGYTREAVAGQLGISNRQFSREQRTALETLALHLWKAYRLESRPGDIEPGAAAGETAWAENLPAEKPSAWAPILQSVLELLRPLFEQHAVTLRYQPDERLPEMVIPQYALRHSLLNVLGLLIPLDTGGELRLTPSVAGRELVIQTERTLTGKAVQNPAALSLHPGMQVARQMIERAEGRLAVEAGPHIARVTVAIPALEQIPVLVIDDNSDTLQLFQRYAQGTRYSVTGCQNPGEAQKLAEGLRPRIVLMDVMMPEVDGWELLARLRQDFPPESMAIVICSILPQASLAQTLGASGFLQKPVLPQDFLPMLDQQFERLAHSPHEP